MFGRLLRSICVWYAYFPHVAMLRLVGPRCALLSARVFGWLHAVSPFSRAQRRVRYVIRQAIGQSQPDLNISKTMRRYLMLKHQRFVEWYVYPTPRGRRFVERSYRQFEGREHLDGALSGGKGVIVLIFHFGLAKMIFPALQALNYDNYHHVFRGATYAGRVYDRVAKAAMAKLAQSEEESGLKVIYHRPYFTFETMVRLLRKNVIVGMNADGMMGTDFVELPFLDGMMTFPSGPARLAAHSGAPIVSMYCLPGGVCGHRLIAHPRILCESDSPSSVEATVGKYVGLLESYTRRYPWAWWTWRRLQVTTKNGGQTSFTARALTTEEGWYHTADATAQGGDPSMVDTSPAL